MCSEQQPDRFCVSVPLPSTDCTNTQIAQAALEDLRSYNVLAHCKGCSYLSLDSWAGHHYWQQGLLYAEGFMLELPPGPRMCSVTQWGTGTKGSMSQEWRIETAAVWGGGVGETAAGIKWHSLTQLPWKLSSQGQNLMYCNEANDKNIKTCIVSDPKKGPWPRQREFCRLPIVPFMFTEHTVHDYCAQKKNSRSISHALIPCSGL